MKKLLFVAVLFSLGIVSCKKDEEAKPVVKAESSIMLGEKKDMSGWD